MARKKTSKEKQGEMWSAEDAIAASPIWSGKEKEPKGKMKAKKQKWDALDKALMGLYGYDLDRPGASSPRFGSGFRPILSVDGETMLMEPTPYNLAIHLGYMDWMEPIVKKLTQIKLPPDQFKRLTDMCRKGSRELLEPQLVKLRKALLSSDRPCYLYCVSEITAETDLVSGKPLNAEGPRVLCLLPKTPEVAKQYGLSESETALLAPQVVWLVTNVLLSRHVLNTPDQLAEAIDGWPVYLSPVTVEQIQQRLAQDYPQLASLQLKALSPGA